MKSFHFYLAATALVSVQLAGLSSFGQTDVIRTGRFTRGTGTNANYQSFVVPLDMEKGLACADNGGLAASLYPWNPATLYHYNATNPASLANLSLRLPFANPLAAFGSRAGGDTLYYGEQYRFGMHAGYAVGMLLYVYSISPAGVATQINAVPIALPDPSNTNDWGAFLTNGYVRTFTTNGLTTIINLDPTYTHWGTADQGALTITHSASTQASNYVFQVGLVGLTDGGTGSWYYMAYNADGYGVYEPMYILNFDPRPAWRSVFIDSPHFDGEPLPPTYQGKSTDELLTNMPAVSTTFSLSNSPNTYTNLDQSPELRRHPILDQFVSDMRRDPLALARYVFNEVELTDAMDYNDNGSLNEVCVSPPGVARSALGTFLEGQGGPAEQCALLVYLLRQAGVPAVYVYPPHNGLKMLDTRLSKLLRIQFKGAVNNLGQTYTTNNLIPVNYPWVAMYNGTNWVHLFPWLKDTDLEEGFNLYNYMGSNYYNGFEWTRDYMYGATNILSLANGGNDTPSVLFPAFVKQMLLQNAPGLSLDDLGVKFVNRRRTYARWQDFPTPFVVPTNAVALDSLGSPAITNVFAGLTNIFDTFSVEVSSQATLSKKLSTGDLRLADIHDRRFLIRHEKTGVNTHNMILSLAAYRTNATGPTNFTIGDTLLNFQQISTNLTSADDWLNVKLTYKRHRSLPITVFTNPPSPYMDYPSVWARTTITDTRILRKGDLAAICVNVGRVSRDMLNVQAQDLWNMEAMLKANPSATTNIAPDLYQGGPAYLCGMAYYESTSRFRQVNSALHKIHVASQCAFGLAKLSAKRVSGALTNNGDIILIQPNVDMSFYDSAVAFNGSIHSDSGDEQYAALMSFRALDAAHCSAEEHQILNTFYQGSDSISTMKLLQLAQARSGVAKPGVFALNYLNYIQMGNSNISGTLLKGYDTNVWTQTTNYLTRYDAGANQVFLTPGWVTNVSNSYKGMGAFMWSAGGDYIAAISANQNGGFFSILPDASFTAPNSPNMSLGLDPNNDFNFNLGAPSSANRTAAPDSYAGYSSTSIANNSTAGDYSFSQFQTSWTGDLNDVLGLASQGAQNLNFSQGVLAANGNNGYLGWTGDALSQQGSSLADPVHSVTGEFYVNANDLSLPGPMPLTIARNYSSLNLAENEFGFGWKLNYTPYLSLNSNGTVIFAAEPDGSVLAYQQTATNANLFLPNPALNPQLNNNRNAGIGSSANRLRNRIEKSGTFYYLYPPVGGKRTFQVIAFTGGTYNRTRPYLTRWEDANGNFFTFEYGTDATQPDYAEVRRVQSSNGNYLGFKFDVYGHIISAYTGDGRWMDYEYDQFGDLVNVTLPDMATLQYEYEHKTMSITNGSTVTTALYSTHLILVEDKPDGRTLKNEYDQNRRVTNQWSTVGSDLALVRNAAFIYSNNFNLTNSYTNTITGYTLVKDVFNHTNRYDYSGGLITNIVDALGQTNAQLWYADNVTAPGYPRSLWRTKDKRGLWTEFKYDSNGNVTNTVTWGDLTGDGTTQYATNTVAYDTNNLPTLATDPAGNKVQTIYHPQYSFLPQYVITYAGSTPTVTNKMTYGNVTNIFVSGGASYTNMAFGMPLQQIRAFVSSDAATNEWNCDGRGFMTQSTRYTGTSDSAVATTFFYNDRGQQVQQTDGAGRKTVLDFDALGRPISHEVYEAGSTMPLAWNYSYYNANGELTWNDGPAYNPEDYTYRDYDGAGHLTTEIHWRAQAKTDGTGVEAPSGYDLYAQSFFEYDKFGNLTRSVDPRQAITTNSWDALGRLVQRTSFDTDGATVLSTMGFAYEPGGQVRYQTNGLGGVTETQYTTRGQPEYRRGFDGATNGWRYYLDGRIRREIQRNGAYWETTYDDANRKSTRIFYSATGTALATNIAELDRRGNLWRRTDEAGNVFTNSFDGLDRIKLAAGPPIQTVSFDPFTGQYTTNTLQQVTTYTYDNSGKVLTVANATGEKTITTSDALGRPVSVEIRDSGNSQVRLTTTSYGPDHHSVTVTNGTSSTAIVSTSCIDNDGRPLISLAYPSSNVREFTYRSYDLSGNLAYEERDSATNGAVPAAWSSVGYSSDGLNRITAKSERDSAVTYFYYDNAGNLTYRLMPRQWLAWQGNYNAACQLTNESVVGVGGVITRVNTHSYFPSGSPFAGLPQTLVDGRGVTCTYSYDDWLHPVTNAYTGSLNEQNVTTVSHYEARGFVTDITERFANSITGPSTEIQRSFDPYGQLASETVLVGGAAISSASQGWDVAGRRTTLRLGNGYGFGWRADGLLSSVSFGQLGGASYGYTSAGLVSTRTVGARVTTTSSRDGVGRPLSVATTVNTLTKLAETLTWTGDGQLNSHSLAREDFTDSRSYVYGDLTRRLTEERLNLDASRRWTNQFTFDDNYTAGPGVLSRVGQTPTSATWSSSQDAFSRIASETNTYSRQMAYGKLNGSATVSLSLDNVPLSFSIVGTTDPLWPLQWRATMELTAGAHRLDAQAVHSSQLFTTNAISWFTNNIGSITVTNVQDGNGNLTQRIWRKPNGTTNLVQTLAWDGRGRLYKFTERDAAQSGRDFTVTYDALGRRLRTTEIAVTNNIALTNSPLVTDHYFDPAVEFLELGVSEKGKTSWKLIGSDFDGRYGSQNGTGGFEAVASGNSFSPVVADSFGNVLASLNGISLSWNSSRVSAYGSVSGYRPPAVGGGQGLAAEYGWRNRSVESIGFVWMGGNWLDPVSGRFVSFDPLGFGASDTGYSFCRGNPTAFNWDPDGRLGKQWTDRAMAYEGNVNSVGDFFSAVGYGVGGTALRIPGAISSVFGQASQGMADARQEIYGYSGGQAFLARSLMLPADMAFGTTSLVNDPVDAVAGMPQGFVNFGGKIGTDIYNIGANPSVNNVFNIGEDALGVLGLAQGGVGLYRTGAGLIPKVTPVTTEPPMTTVLGSGRDTTAYANQPGFNVLNMDNLPPAEWARQNALWLNQALQRGDSIWLVTDPAKHAQLMQQLGKTSYYLDLELPMLEQYGANAVPKFTAPPQPVPAPVGSH